MNGRRITIGAVSDPSIDVLDCLTVERQSFWLRTRRHVDAGVRVYFEFRFSRGLSLTLAATAIFSEAMNLAAGPYYSKWRFHADLESAPLIAFLTD